MVYLKSEIWLIVNYSNPGSRGLHRGMLVAPQKIIQILSGSFKCFLVMISKLQCFKKLDYLTNQVGFIIF
ncbi:MAG: hypothetical protein DSY90_13355 [Deltaproteobacteria bacterium]|nr:MAG: hypothetical protein DSY90_13355 [Deltaproteobacteria bacterium]